MIIPHSLPNQANLHTTVILGAGVIGLSTAYHLAKRPDKHPGHRIIVIDIQKHLFAAASQYNSGILSYQWFSGDLRKFAEYCYEFYEDLSSKDSGFRKQTGYRDHSNFRLVCGASPSGVEAPQWLAVPEGWHVEDDPEDGRAAIIHPTGLGKWLLQECQQNGVEVYNRARIVNVQLSEAGIPDRVHIYRGGQILDICCHDLVFAAGAWTPRLFDELFPNSNTCLYPTTNSGNWVLVRNPEEESIFLGQVTFDSIVGHQLEFVARDDGTMWISGLSNRKACLGSVEGKAPPDEEAMSKLLDYAEQFLIGLPHRVLSRQAAHTDQQLIGIFRLLPVFQWVKSMAGAEAFSFVLVMESTERKADESGSHG